MAQYTLQLDNFANVNGKLKLTFIYNGAKLKQTFDDKQALIEWSTMGETLGLDDLVRHAIRKALTVDPTLSDPSNFIGKVLTVTITSEVTNGV